MKYYSVAIDGPAGAGKSTIARRVSEALGYLYIDTGAIYRTVALYMIKNGISIQDQQAVADALGKFVIEIKHGENGLQHMVLDGEDVTTQIRNDEVSLGASDVSKIPAVRAFLLDTQRGFARTNNVVMDGRDIGTVVLPNAEVKIFLTASVEIRARRRYLEYVEKGMKVEFDEVLEDVVKRDYNDTHREIAPLAPAEDSILVDTSELDFEQSCEKILGIIKEKTA